MRIAIYYTHFQSLGHTTRIRNLVEILKKGNAKILVIQAGKPQNFLSYETKTSDVPFSIAGKEVFKGGRAKISKERIKKRVYFIKRELGKFKPDIFITEFFPFGRRIFSMEIVTLIRYLKIINPKIKIYASVGYPVIENERVLKFSKYYDKILIHCPENLDLRYIKKALIQINRRDILDFYEKVFSVIKNKVVFTNYLIDNKKPSQKEEIRKKFGIGRKQKIILVSRGGGVIYPKIISASIKAAEILGNDFFFIVVSGPASNSRENRIFESIAKGRKNVAFLNFYENFQDLLNACDLSISMAGYNTSLETMQLGKRAILVPKFDNLSKAGIEQYYRALLVKDKAGSIILDYSRLDADILARAVRSQITENPATKIKKEWFDSSKAIKKIILG